MRLLFDLDEPETERAGRENRRPNMPTAERDFHIALWKLTKGRGSVLENLAIVASYGHNRPFTVDAVKAIVKRVEWDYPVGDAESEMELTADDRRYLERRYASETDPAVREWLRGNVSPTRSRPDWRRSSDRVGKIGKPRRVRVSSQ